MPTPNASRIVRAGAILLIGLLSGAMVEEYFFLDVILRGFPPEQWLLAHARFGELHPYTVIPVAVLGLLLILLTFVVDRDVGSPRAIATWVAGVAGLVIGGITVVTMMPMNEAIAAWAETGPPPNVAEVPYPALVEDRTLHPIEGRSLMPVFRGGTLDRQAPLYWAYGGQWAIREGDWKLAHDRRRPDRLELFNLREDPAEARDVAADYPARVAELQARWQAWAERVRAQEAKR